MNSTNHDENESPPPEDEDRSLLFGPPKEGREPEGDRQKPRRSGASASSPPSRTSPPAAEAVAEPLDPAGHGETAASSDAVQGEILAPLEDLEKKLAGPAAREADLAAAVRTIAEQIAAATEWINDVKAAISAVLASTGKQIEGLKSGQKDHDAALARLKLQEKELNKVVQALDATAKGLNERSSELGAVKQELATYYRSWTAQAKTSLAEMKTLTERLNAGDHMVTRLEGLQKGWTEQTGKVITENAAAQRTAAKQTSDALEELASARTTFLEDFAEGRKAALAEVRRERTWTRRWTVPALALALVLAAPLFVFAGALGQSEFGVFDPYDDTGGWKEEVWKLYGEPIQDCMLDSKRTTQVIRCSIDVVWR